MDASDGFLDWWWTHKAMLASLILFLWSLVNIYLFHFIAQQRLSKLSLSKVIRQDRHLRWLRRGRSVWFWGTSLLVVLGLICLRRSPRLGDEQGLFLAAALFCVIPLSNGVFGLLTGLCRGLGERSFGEGFYRVAQSPLGWIPWAQIISALTIGGLGLAGFLAMGRH
jgi:hypothetical protein